VFGKAPEGFKRFTPWTPGTSTQLESGVRVFLPVSPFSAPHFRYRDKGGGVSPTGAHYGCEYLDRILVVYLQGSF
jgi:hypothetical protein